jgi:transposase InsO family protein
LTTNDYFTKWIETIPTINASHKGIISFLEDIMSRFCCSSKTVTNNVASFKAKPLIKLFEQYGITLFHSTPYYPQRNGLVESSNKGLIKIIKKLLERRYESMGLKDEICLMG